MGNTCYSIYPSIWQISSLWIFHLITVMLPVPQGLLSYLILLLHCGMYYPCSGVLITALIHCIWSLGFFYRSFSLTVFSIISSTFDMFILSYSIFYYLLEFRRGIFPCYLMINSLVTGGLYLHIIWHTTDKLEDNVNQ